MLVGEDGSLAGSIGGGCVEAEVWEAGKQVLSSGRSQVLPFRLSASEMAESGLICGGSIEVLVEGLEPGALPLYEKIIALRRGGGQGVLATSVPPEEGYRTTEQEDGSASGEKAFKVLVLQSGEVVNALGGPVPMETIKSYAGRMSPGASRVVPVDGAGEQEAEERLFLESIGPQATVYIFGAGHLASELAPLAKRVHFQVVVVDDRPFFANVERFPEADDVLAIPLESAFQTLPVDEDSLVVIVTRGHIHDGVVLEQALASSAPYIGMIGSRAKIRAVYEELEGRGVPREQLEKVHAPIGLDIKARLPEEIAVSILAELIQTRNERLDG